MNFCFPGGTKVNITGYGFSEDISNVNVTVGGLPCLIKESSYDLIKCVISLDTQVGVLLLRVVYIFLQLGHKRTNNTYQGRVGVSPCVSGSHGNHSYLQISSGLQATVIKFTYEASLVSLPEVCNNKSTVII